jgi:hypothetical protein
MKISRLLFLGLLVVVGFCNQSYAMDTGALYKAIEEGNVEQLRNCIAKVTDFNPGNKYDVTGYKLAGGRFYVQSTGIVVAGQETIRTFSPLHLACELNQLAVVRFLVEEYGAVDNDDAASSEALRVAMMAAHDKVVCYLLSKGAKPGQALIDGARQWLENSNNKNDPKYNSYRRIYFYLQGGKAIAGIPLTCMNMGIIAVVCVAGIAAGKYFYNRHYRNKKKNQTDADQADDVQAGERQELTTEPV